MSTTTRVRRETIFGLSNARARFGLAAMICGLVALAVPGGAYAEPGVPEPGTVVYEEDFSSGSPSAGTTPVELTDYTGGAPANNETYTADPAWLPAHNGCNGWILNSGSAPAPASDAGCPVDGGRDDGGINRTAWYFHRYQAYVLGLAQGQSNDEALANNVLASHSNAGVQTAGTFFETATDSTPAVAGHYYAVEFTVSQTHCPSAQEPQWTPAHLDAYLKTGAGAELVVSDVTPCDTGQVYTLVPPHAPSTNPTVTARVTAVTAAARMVSDGGGLGLRIVNTQPSYVGNDIALDLPRIIDVTPRLDKVFTPATIEVGGTSTLTFTITNTSELGAKQGWSFVDTLPEGVTVASPANTSTTCSQGQVVVNEAGTAVTVNGDLEQGEEFCEVTVDVTSSVVAEHVNGPDNVEGNGVVGPGDAVLVVTAPPVRPSATIALDKALDGPRAAPTDQFTLAIREGAADGQVLASSTTTGTGDDIASGSTADIEAVPGMTYFLTEAGAGSTDLGDYRAAVTCIDQAGVQDGLPDNVPTGAGVAITPVDGADIACVITNSAIEDVAPVPPGPGTTLPSTGLSAETPWLLLGGVALVGAGSGALVWARRRRRDALIEP